MRKRTICFAAVATLVVTSALGVFGLRPAPSAAASTGQPAGFAASSVGGQGQPHLTVTSLKDTGPGTLRAALAAGSANVTFQAGLSGTITLGAVVEIPSDTTIDGAGADITISRNGFHVGGWGAIAGQPPATPVHDVWIRHLHFHDINATSASDAIGIGMAATNVWVDHNTFDGAITDGSVDVTQAATDVEISWNHFVHDPISDAGDDKTDLVGAAVPTSDPPTPIVDLTVDHNWYEHTNSRNPMTRSCRCDVYDNVLDNTGTATGGYGMKAGCGATLWARDDAWLNQNGNRSPLTFESGCATGRQPAALVEGVYAVGVTAPTSTNPSIVTWPQTITVPAAEPMDQTEVNAIKAGAGYNTAPPQTTTTTTSSTTPSTTTTTLPTTTTTPPSNLPGDVTLVKTASDAVTLSWSAVTGANSYDWRILTCAGVKIYESTTTALTKSKAALTPGCYLGQVSARTAPYPAPYGPLVTSNTVTL